MMNFGDVYMTNKNRTFNMTGEGLRFLTSFGMTGERLERGEGADTAATSIRKTETIVAAVSAPSFFSRRAVIPSPLIPLSVPPKGEDLPRWEMTPRSGKINSVGHRPTKMMPVPFVRLKA